MCGPKESEICCVLVLLCQAAQSNHAPCSSNGSGLPQHARSASKSVGLDARQCPSAPLICDSQLGEVVPVVEVFGVRARLFGVLNHPSGGLGAARFERPSPAATSPPGPR